MQCEEGQPCVAAPFFLAFMRKLRLPKEEIPMPVISFRRVPNGNLIEPIL